MDEDIELKIKYLKSYKNIESKLQCLEDQKQSVIESMESAKHKSYDGMPSAHRKSDLSDLLVKLEHFYEEIEQVNAEYIAAKVSIESIVLHMGDGINGQILRKKYIEHKSFEDIGYETNYSSKQIKRRHIIALNQISIDDIPKKFIEENQEEEYE